MRVTAQWIARLSSRLFQLLGTGAALSILAAALLLTSPAEAQSPPSSPQPSASCTGRASAGPQPVLAGDEREIELLASGLDPSAAYVVFIEGNIVATGMTSGDGRVGLALVLRPLVAAVLDVQVATAGRCAATTLTVIGPRRAPVCVVITVQDEDGGTSTHAQGVCPPLGLREGDLTR